MEGNGLNGEDDDQAVGEGHTGGNWIIIPYHKSVKEKLWRVK